MLFLIIGIKLNSIAFHFFKKSSIKVALTVTIFNVTYFVFNVFFVIIFYSFKAYDIKLFVIKKTYSVIDLKVGKLLVKQKCIVLYNSKLLY